MRPITLLLAGLLAGASVSAQTSAPRADPSQTFRSGTRLVQVSVIVHDGARRPVSGLSAADFQVFEDGQEVPVALFQVSSRIAREADSAARGIFSNRIESVSNGGVVAIVYDRLNTDALDQKRVREHIVKYLGQVNPDDRIALYVLDGHGMRVLHDFTRDARSLLRVLSRARSSEDTALVGSEATLPEHIGFGDALDAELDAFASGAEENMRAFFQRNRALTSVEALEHVAAHLAGVPGRKNLVWMSGGFPFEYRPAQPAESNHQTRMSLETARAARALNDGDIAVYAIDARGLVGAFSSSASARMQSFTTIDTVQKPIEGLRQFAQLTGGDAFFNTNDLGAAIRRAVEDSRLTYVIGYYSPNDTWDGKLRKIEVKVRRKGVDVRHRAGYYALPQELAGEGTREDAVLDALESPLEATALPFNVTVGPLVDGKRSLTIHIDAAVPAFTERDGRWHGALDIAVAQTLPSGQRTKEADTRVPLSLTSEDRSRMLKEGLRLTVTLAPRDEAHDVRLVVRDASTGKVGSVIIPAAATR